MFCQLNLAELTRLIVYCKQWLIIQINSFQFQGQRYQFSFVHSNAVVHKTYIIIYAINM